jgi:predicted PurR-regulated permease PerM
MNTELNAKTGGVLVSLAAFVVVVAGIKAAAPLMVPFLLAVFIAIIIAPPYQWLQVKGLSGGMALLTVMAALVTLMLLTGALIGSSLDNFSRELPGYQSRLREITAGLIQWLAGHGLVISVETVTQYLDPGKAMKLVSTLLSSMGNMLTDSFLILITVIFLLLEAAGLPDKWRAASGNAEATLAQFGTATRNINHYMGIKTLASLATGLVVAVWLWIVGVDYPLLWGLLAFLLNFVPNIGSILAAVPAVLLALIQLGVTQALLAVAGYAVVNVVIGNFIEPRFMGRGLGLSTLVVFLSLVFWGWVLGPVGMLLSVPLTIAVKIVLDSRADTRWMAVMLGPRVAGAGAGKGDELGPVLEDSAQAMQDTDNA